MTTSIRLQAFLSLSKDSFFDNKPYNRKTGKRGIYMVGWLIRRFVPNWQDTKKAKVRQGVGNVCGIVGIVLNLFLFVSKYLVGVLVQSVSIRADGLNNLTDAASNIVSIISFKLAENLQTRNIPMDMSEANTSLRCLWDWVWRSWDTKP